MHNPHPRPSLFLKERSSGQVLVIFAVSLLALLFFVGLAVDAGTMYVTYGQLKRGVDAAAISAAITFKRGETVVEMNTAAAEVLRLQNFDMSAVDLQVHICDEDGDGITDPGLDAISHEFYVRCPAPPNGSIPAEAPRKLVFVKASVKSPFYFLSLLGFKALTLSSFSIAETAPIDLVLVMDVSESMGYLSTSYNPNVDFKPNVSCNPNSGNRANSTNACRPLWDAKDAASQLIGATLYQGYDRVSTITFDSQSRVVFDLTDQLSTAQNLLWSGVLLHDDPDYRHIWPQWLDQYAYDAASHTYVKTRPFLFNPVNPEDRDGDGKDADSSSLTGYTCPVVGVGTPPMTQLQYDTVMADRWWDYNPTHDPSKDNPGSPADPYGWGGVPCDEDHTLDAFDWNGDGVYTSADTTLEQAYYNSYLPYYNPSYPTLTTIPSLSVLSTCTGCGLRTASNEFKKFGRPGAVWVMVFLSDGAANLSDTSNTGPLAPGDTPNTGGALPASYPNGFCSAKLNNTIDVTTSPNISWWQGPHWCEDADFTPRYCLYVNDTNPDHIHQADCPSDATPISVLAASTTVRRYSVVDYARDMADMAVKQNQIAIYTIGLNVQPNSSAEKLLRYIAWVGDDPTRQHADPCELVAGNTTCGQYYFASPNDLRRIFDDIATRIYTKLSE